VSESLVASARLPAAVLVAAGIVLLLPDCSLSAAEPIWTADRAAAIAQARKQGKLLLVVQLSGDFVVNSPDSPEAVTYRTAAFSNERVRQALAARFVVAYQQIGPASGLSVVLPKRSKSPPPDDFAVTYVCLPDSRVLHFIPGFVTVDELLAEIAWVERHYSTLVQASAAEEEAVWRQCHVTKLPQVDAALFHSLFSPRWQAGQLRDGPSTVDLPAVTVAARTTFEQTVAVPSAVGRDRRSLHALAGHGALGVEFAHLVLSEFPLIALRDLERPALEAWAGRRFWSVSPRRNELAGCWQAAQQREEATLLVVADDPFAAKRGETDSFVWPPADRSWTEPPGCTDLLVSIDELAALAVDVGLDPIAYKANDGPPRFLLYRGGGRPELRINRGEGLTRLKQALAIAEKAGVPAKLVAKRRVE
jgi:hypothetical protein